MAKPDGQEEDVDGDSTPELLAIGYTEVEIFVRQGDCYRHITTVRVGGDVAFVDVLDAKHAGMRDLSIDTWLYHGDRKRDTWMWTGSEYVASGFDELVPGPKRL